MRILLDTNVLAFYLYANSELSEDVKEILTDYSNVLYTSSTSVCELMHLCQIGKLKQDCSKVLQLIAQNYVSIVPASERHLGVLAGLPLYADHRDPMDRLIIAQAIGDRTLLVSSDRKFQRYVAHGLHFFYNER